MTISVYSPANNLITVKVTNHQATPRSKRNSAIKLVPATGTLDDLGDTLAFKSGQLEAHINKKIFSIKFIYCGNELCSQTANMPVFYKTSSGTENNFVLASDACTGASFNLGSRELIYGLGSAGSSIVRNGQIVKCNVADSIPGTAFIPFILSDSKYALHVNSNRPVTFDIGSDSGKLSFEAESEEVEYSIIAGDTLTEILEVFSQLSGRTPALSYTTAGVSLALDDDYTLTAQGIIDTLRNAKNSVMVTTLLL
jgi:alpha-glucosidase (family GH31 glycosyl hydrolase)